MGTWSFLYRKDANKGVFLCIETIEFMSDRAFILQNGSNEKRKKPNNV
jgi:hypothetical protein